MSRKIKKGDRVVVISGANKGESGAVLQVQPRRERVIIENVNMRKNTNPRRRTIRGCHRRARITNSHFQRHASEALRRPQVLTLLIIKTFRSAGLQL